MSVNSSAQTLEVSATCRDVLHAAGTPSDFRGAALVLPTLQRCLSAARTTWPDASFQDWHQAVQQFQSYVARIAASNLEAVAHLHKTPSIADPVFETIEGWKSTQTAGIFQVIQALLGRALVINAQSKSSLPLEFLKGLKTLQNQALGRGGLSKDWHKVAQVGLLSSSEISTLSEALGPRSPCFKFLEQLQVVLSSGVQAPISESARRIESSVPLISAESPIAVDSANEQSVDPGQQADKVGTIEAEDQAVWDADTTRVGARMAAADFSPAVAKLGIPFRDQILTGDLVGLTKKMSADLASDDRQIVGFATLGLISFVTGTSDAFALGLSFKPKAGHLWIDRQRQAWCWDFNAYRAKGTTDSEPTGIHPVVVPLPAGLFQVIDRPELQGSDFSTVKDLISAIQGVGEVDLKAFRLYLRSLGDAAHPPYRGRLANSLSATILEITGSDMLAGLLAAQFTGVAPAALYYFGPSYETIYKRLGVIYDRLELGTPTRPVSPEKRAGGHHIPERQAMQNGWHQLVERIGAVRKLTLEAPDTGARLTHANEWMALLCAAFVIGSAHRGSRFDQLTLGAIAASDQLMILHDKDLEDQLLRVQPRLLPKTKVIQAIVCSAVECHELVARLTHAGSAWQRKNTPVFAGFDSDTGEIVGNVEVATVAALIAGLFDGAPINFARSAWVTTLDDNGCDRWLIRVLTGHVRDITRPSGPYFDLPADIAAQRLGAEMDTAFIALFGAGLPDRKAKTLVLGPFFPKLVFFGKVRSPKGFPDSASALVPLDVDVLMGAVLAGTLRQELFQGFYTDDVAIQLLLHLLLIDLIPDPKVALDAVCDPNRHLRTDLARPAITWERPHFEHRVWLPLSAPSSQLFNRRGGDVITMGAITSRLRAALLTSSLRDGIKKDKEACWDAICTWSGSFRRLHLQPSMLAVSHPAITSPCLNLRSIARLAGVVSEVPVQRRRPPQKEYKSSLSRSSGITELRAILGKYANSELQIGEKRKRAILALADIGNLKLNWSPGDAWLRDWLIDELIRTRDAAKGHYQISSLATYFSTLSLGAKALAGSDPMEWDEEDWDQYIDSVCAAATGKSPKAGAEIDKRSKPAIAAVADSLVRRKIYVPRTVLMRLLEKVDDDVRSDSASSVLITHQNLSQAVELARSWLKDEPATLLRLQIRSHLGSHIPMRAADFGNLKRTCLTPSGGLVIERSGFNNLKTEASVRVSVLTSEGLSTFSHLRDELLKYQPEGDLLLRGSGSHAEVIDDLQSADIFSHALKAVTQDARARLHGLRAATLEELTWPGWQTVGRAFLTGELKSVVLTQWVSDSLLHWTNLARACAMAGQSGIQSAIGNYLAGWSIVHAMHAFSLATAHTVSPGYTNSLGLTDDALRKARSLSKQAGVPQFCAWDWYEAQAVKRRKQAAVASKPIAASRGSVSRVSDGTIVPVQPSATMPATLAASDPFLALKYTTLRSLGMPTEAAMTQCRLTQSAAFALEEVLPSASENAANVKRARNGVTPRGENANLELAGGATGDLLLAWVCGLSPTVLDFGLQVIVRSSIEDRNMLASNLWAPLAKDLPVGISLIVKRGSAHMTAMELANTHGMDRVMFKADRDIGYRPLVTLSSTNTANRVLQSRLTSVVRVMLTCAARLKSKKG